MLHNNKIVEHPLIPKLAILELVNDDKNYKIIYNNRAFLIGKLLYQLIDQLKKGMHLDEFVDYIHEHERYEVDRENLYTILKEKIEKLNALLEDNPTKRNSDYILVKTQIASDKLVGTLSNTLTFLYERNNFIIAILSIVTTQLAYLKYGTAIPVFFSVNILAAKDLVIAYLLAILVLLFHELGHATAANFFGVKPKEIGFGFYLIFPVFYADVTAVWKLDKYKRIIVNIGGVYFQGLLHILFILYLYFLPNCNHTLTIIFTFLYKINIAVIVYSLMPFFRNDGYWVYSDFFDLPNLNEKAFRYPKELFYGFKNRLPEKNFYSFNSKKFITQLPLLIYSVSNYVVMCFFFLFFLKMILATGSEIVSGFMNTDSSLSNTQLIAKTIFLIVSISLMSYNYRNLVRNIYQYLVTKYFSNVSNK